MLVKTELINPPLVSHYLKTSDLKLNFLDIIYIEDKGLHNTKKTKTK